VVEAKKLSLGPQNVLLQAERYSKGIAQPGIGEAILFIETITPTPAVPKP
jgi:hypothetical protein